MPKFVAAAGAAVALSVAITACAPTAGSTGGSPGADETPQRAATETWDPAAWDITELCGDEEITVALADGQAGNTWRKVVWGVFQQEAAKCPNITSVLYTDGAGDNQKASSDIVSLVAQGVDVIVALPDTGDAILPAYRDAVEAGVTLISYFAPINGQVGVDYTDTVLADTYSYGRQMGQWVADNVDGGNVIVLGGIPGCSSCAGMYKGAGEVLEGTDLVLQGAGPIVTNYNPQEAEQAVSGLLSQYGTIPAVLGDYGLVAQAAMNAFTPADQPLPALAISSGQNSVYCGWWENKNAGIDQPFAEWGGATQIVRAALRRGLAHFNDISWDEPHEINLPKVIDTAAGVLPPDCRADLPDDTDMFSDLSEAELKAAIG